MADTTAESQTSVKRAHAIGTCGLAAAGRRGGGNAGANSSPGASAEPRNGVPTATSGAAVDIAQLLQAGQDALNHGPLDEAERDFRQVLAVNPQLGGAYANLGVV
ncbi:MAG: hypothetical protein WCA20_19525 [Candidatus Sulfotelmatobacter sp.]